MLLQIMYKVNVFNMVANFMFAFTKLINYYFINYQHFCI